MSSTAKQRDEEILQRIRHMAAETQGRNQEFPNLTEITVYESQWKLLIRKVNKQAVEIQRLNEDAAHMLDLVNNASAALRGKDREIERLKTKLETIETYASALMDYTKR